MTSLDYKKVKQQVSIIDVALRLGYVFDKSKGTRDNLHFVIKDEFGKQVDSIYITNPKDNATMGYWKRGGEKGDLIDFVRHNLNGLGAVGQTEYARVQNALTSLIGYKGDLSQAFFERNNITRSRPFDANRYTVVPLETCINQSMGFFRERHLCRATVETFAPFMVRATDKESKYGISNLGFPYTRPGGEEMVGMEIRGFKGFKQKAEGTDSTHGVWIADFSKGVSDNITHVFFAESQYDLMAFYQLNRLKFDLSTCAFVATGGSFSDTQITDTMQYYRNAKAIDCFDNDMQGNIYSCRMAALLAGKAMNISKTPDGYRFEVAGKYVEMDKDKINVSALRPLLGRVERFQRWKPFKGFKDWNDVTLGKRLCEDKTVSLSEHRADLKDKRRQMSM